MNRQHEYNRRSRSTLSPIGRIPPLTGCFLFFLSGSPNTSSTVVPAAPALFFVPTPAPPLRIPAEDAPSPSPGILADDRLDAMMRRVAGMMCVPIRRPT
jgi:hypothetical protein